MATEHIWKFFRAGGVDQVLLERGSDIANLHELDLKLWIAVAMPVKGVDLDPKTALFLDTDRDDRIRAPDILATVEWLKKRMVSLDGLIAGKSEVSLANIATPELRASAERIARAAAPDTTTISVEQIDAADKRFTESAFNGDAIITEKTPDTDALRDLVTTIIKTHGSVPDRLATAGIDATKVKDFFVDAAALDAWRVEGESDAVAKPLGATMTANADLFRALRPKLEDYYTRCRLASLDERAASLAHGADAGISNLAGKDLAPSSPELRSMPLARIAANQPLPFEDTSNPAYATELLTLRDEIAKPLLGITSNTLTEAEYRGLVTRFAPYEAWWVKKPASKLDALPKEFVHTLVTDDSRAALEALIDRDAAQKGELDHILEVEKLVYLNRDFAKVLRNFVSFVDFYAKRGAMFQAGTLYLDARGCELCIDVADAAKHAVLASLASTYLAYCECKRKGEPTRLIVAAFTAGDSDNLMVGRNGVFVDRTGKDWDATITKTIENPISIRQAFFSPYKKFVRIVEEQVAKRASDADAESQARVTAAAQATANADRAAAVAAGGPALPASASVIAPAAAPARRTVDVGTVAAIGVAIGGIGAMVTGILGAFFGLGIFMPFGIIALIMMISGPSMLLAFLKLRRRNLGPLLDASGWAVNGLATINVPFGGALTDLAVLPANATRILQDPYAEKKRPWKSYTIIALLVMLAVGWAAGKFDRVLPRKVTAKHVLHGDRRAPAAETRP